jgi:hypothetical protein
MVVLYRQSHFFIQLNKESLIKQEENLFLKEVLEKKLFLKTNGIITNSIGSLIPND